MNVQFHVWLPEDSIRIERRIHRHHRESQRAKLGPKKFNCLVLLYLIVPVMERSANDRRILETTSQLNLTGWWYTYPSEKYESQMDLLFPIYGNIKNVPNHQPVNIVQAQSLWISSVTTAQSAAHRIPPKFFGHTRGLFVRAVHAYAGGGWLQHQPPKKRISGGSSSQKGVKVKTILTISNEKSGDFISATSWQIREIHPLQHRFMAPDFSLSSTASWCNWRSKPRSCCKIYLTLSNHLFICCQPS